MLHLLRKNLKGPCPVCAAKEFVPCIVKQGDEEPEQMELELGGNVKEIACVEYQILAGVRRLRQLRPEHVLVRCVTAVLKYQSQGQEQQ